MTDRIENLEGQIADLQKKLDRLTAKTDSTRKAGLVETLSALSPLISGVLIATVGTVATILYNERQLQLTQLAALDKYRTYLTSENSQERAFGYEAFVALGQENFVIKLIGAKNDKAGKNVLESLVDSSKDNRIQQAAKEQLDKLGSLSAKYEVSHDPDFVGIDTFVGELSYGKYAFGSNSIIPFFRFLEKEYPKFAVKLEAAGGANAASEGTQDFQSTWKSLGTDPLFSKAQDDFVQEKYYEKAANDLIPLGLDIRRRSRALQNVIWSMSVQHGPGRVKRIVQKALGGQAIAKLDDEEIIKVIYEGRAKDIEQKPLVTVLITKLLERLDEEKAQAIQMLQNERIKEAETLRQD